MVGCTKKKTCWYYKKKYYSLLQKQSNNRMTFNKTIYKIYSKELN